MVRLLFINSFNKYYVSSICARHWRMTHEEDRWSPRCHGVFIPYRILCEMFWYLPTVIGSISRLGSDLSKEWKNVKCFYLRRVRWGYVRHNKEWVHYNGTKAYQPPAQTWGRSLVLTKLGLASMGQETWMDGTLGLIQHMVPQLYPLCVNQLSWLVLSKIIYYTDESKTYNSQALF